MPPLAKVPRCTEPAGPALDMVDFLLINEC
jgi:hypothetical protein